MITEDNIRHGAREELQRRQQLMGRKEAAEESLYEFIKMFWHCVEPEKPFVEGWALEGICEHLMAIERGDITRLIMNVPPGFSKSLSTDVFFPAWEWGPRNKPTMRYICTSSQAYLTERDNGRFLRVISDPVYQRLWGDRFTLDLQGVSNITNKQTGWKLATTVGGISTGARGNRVICLPCEAMVKTDHGDIAIGEIVEKRLPVKIAGYDGTRIVWQEIETYQKNPFRGFVRISHEKGSLVCTEDHRVYTQRGIIHAAEIKPSDILWTFSREALQEMRQTDLEQAKPCERKDLLRLCLQIKGWLRGIAKCQYNALRGMWKTCLSCASASSQSWTGILWAKLSAQIQYRNQQSSMARRKEADNVPAVPKSIRQQVLQWAQTKVLFAKMFRAFPEIAHEGLSDVRENISTKEPLTHSLRARMCKQKTFLENVWKGKWPLDTRKCGKSISERVVKNIQGSNTRTRWAEMFSLRNDAATAQTKKTLCPPYRLQQGQSFGVKLVNLLPFLSRKDARPPKESRGMEKTSVIAVERISRIEKFTYNVCVTPYHNYFADGVLIANCDDPNSTDPAKNESEIQREAINNWLMEVMPDRLNSLEEDSIILIQQRTHERDATATLLERGQDYIHYSIPMEYDPMRHCETSIGWSDPRSMDGELAWAERFSPEVLGKLKIEKGPVAWAGQYQQSPTTRGGNIIKQDWWKLYDLDYAKRLGLIPQGGTKLIYPPFDLVICSVDTALTEKKENCYSACTVWGVWKDEKNLTKIMLIYAWQARLPLHGVSPLPGDREEEKKAKEGLVERIARTASPLPLGVTPKGAQAILIEAKANGHDVINELARLYRNYQWQVIPIDPKGDKVARVHAIVPTFTQGLIYAPDKGWAQLVINQALSFPRGRDKDLVDSMTMALLYMRNAGIIMRPDEEAEENNSRNALQIEDEEENIYHV